MKARVTVMLKNGVLDPQGEAVKHALGTLGFAGVNGVRQGKVIELDLDATDKAKAEAGAWRISEGTLLNLAFFGGTAGAYAGRALFRHKTRKQPFSGQLHTIAVFQLIAAVFLTVFFW